MPNIKIWKGYRFFFYSNENQEPPHIHVEKAGADAKIWLGSLRFAYSYGLTTKQKREIANFVKAHHREFKDAWYDVHGK